MNLLTAVSLVDKVAAAGDIATLPQRAAGEWIQRGGISWITVQHSIRQDIRRTNLCSIVAAARDIAPLPLVAALPTE